MQTVSEYCQSLEKERQEAFVTLFEVLQTNLPKGFQETISYGMPGFVVPLNLYPQGYHCKANQPLPFINVVWQKNHLALYHMGLYADTELLKWFTENYPKHSKTKLDMGKSCIRFKINQEIPYALIAQLAQKMTPQEWISLYEKQLKR